MQRCGILRRMPSPVLPVDAARGDARHRDVRAEVFAVVPQRRPGLGKRLFSELLHGLFFVNDLFRGGNQLLVHATTNGAEPSD